MLHGTALAIPDIVPRESWELEFRSTHAIPSSTRREPAKGLLLYSEILNLGSPMRVLDAGSGNGRNTVYLAEKGCEVTATDFSDFALIETKRRVEEAGFSSRVSVVRQSLDKNILFPTESYDLVLDSYVSCHFLADRGWHAFWRELRRVTKNGGRVLSIAFSLDDEYYSKLLKDSPDGRLVCDPANGIWKRLHSEEEIKGLYAQYFAVEYFSKFEFMDEVLGKNFRRVIFSSVLKKHPS